jgi:hypothetical protein
MIRCIELWTDANQKSPLAEGFIEPDPGGRAQRQNSDRLGAVHQTDAGPKVWKAPGYRSTTGHCARRAVFETPGGRFEPLPGDILFTEDTSCAGHNRKFVSDEPWRRAYVILRPRAEVLFRTCKPQLATA